MICLNYPSLPPPTDLDLAFTTVTILIAAETMGAMSKDGMDFLCDLGSTDDHRENAFLFQRLSVLIPRYSAVAVLGTFTHTTPEDES